MTATSTQKAYLKMESDRSLEASPTTEKQPVLSLNADSADLRLIRGKIPVTALIVVCLSFFERLAFNAVTTPLRELRNAHL